MKRESDKISELISDLPNQILGAYSVDIPKISKNFKKVVIMGMGGSYIGGGIFKRLIQDEVEIPIQICNSLNSLEEGSLLILSSYSGNTKEVIEIFHEFKINSKYKMLILSSGGKLINLAEKYKIPFIKIKENLHQRFTISYNIFPLIRLFEEIGLIKSKKTFINKIVKILIKERDKLENETIKLALILHKRTPLFYSSNFFYPLAYRFQTSLEEDAKVICHSNKITELFHNELECFPNKEYFPVLIIDKKEMSKFSGQIEYFKKLIKEYYEFKYEKYSKEERMIIGLYFVDCLGYYLSKLKNAPMGETPLSDKIKKL